MIKMNLLALLMIAVTPLFATNLSVTENRSLGFHLYTGGTTTDIRICDHANSCLTFKVLRTDYDQTLYQEVNGKCELAVETYQKSFAQGDTDNEFMLDLQVQAVRLTQGEDQCALEANLTHELRSLTGLYL